MALNIEAAMELRGVTLTRLAKRMKVAVSTCHSMIHGNPTVDTLEKIATALRCDVAELFDCPPGWTNRK